MTGPFPGYAVVYWLRGWAGAIPLPARRKAPPPVGWTGYDGGWPSEEQVRAWASDPAYAQANIGIRLPETVLGIDVDCYDGKPGAATLADNVARLGPLPSTYRSTSRDDGSAIGLYRVPVGRVWADTLGPGVEMIHYGHRYAVAWPSVHPEGREYRWLTPDGGIAKVCPRVVDLPVLPAAWVDELDRGPVGDRVIKHNLTSVEAAVILDGLPAGPECPLIAERTDKAVADLANAISRHDAARNHALAILGYANEGHRGGREGLARLRLTFLAATHGDPGRANEAEWTRLVCGGVALLTVTPATERHCCPTPLVRWEPTMDSRPTAGTPSRRVRLTAAASIKPRPVRWLWQDRIPAGEITLTPGRGGIGKSTFHVWLIAELTTGRLPGVHYGTPRVCVIAAREDSWERTIVPRLIAAGANLDMVYRADVVDGAVEGVGLTLPVDCAALAVEIETVNAVLVSVDPLLSTIDGALDTHRNRDVRRALEPLSNVADITGCAILGNAHFNKSSGSDPLALITGSSAFGEVIRAAIGAARDPDADDGSCVASQLKNNLGRTDLPSLRYTIEPAVVHTAEGPAEVGRLRWLGESDRSVRDILNDRDEGEDRTERDSATEWLRGYLVDRGGEANPNDIKRDARASGFAIRTVERARHRAGVTTQRIGFGKGAAYMWRFELASSPCPPMPATTPEMAHMADDGEHAQNGHHTELPGCVVCGEPMVIIEAGQTTHPTCEKR